MDRIKQPFLQLGLLLTIMIYAFILMLLWPIHLLIGLFTFKNSKFYDYEIKVLHLMPRMPEFALIQKAIPQQKRLVFEFTSEQDMHNEINRQKGTGYNHVRRSKPKWNENRTSFLVTIDFERNPNFVE
jgi:hypothetical protein